MRVVMLDLYQRKTDRLCVPPGPYGRGIVRVKVADNHFWFESVEVAELRDGSVKGVARFLRTEIAYVLTEPYLPAETDCDRALEMSANGEGRPQIMGYYHWKRGESAGAAQDL